MSRRTPSLRAVGVKAHRRKQSQDTLKVKLLPGQEVYDVESDQPMVLAVRVVLEIPLEALKALD